MEELNELKLQMADLHQTELLALYFVYMRRCSLAQAAEIVGTTRDKMRTFALRVHDKIYPNLDMPNAWEKIASLYSQLSEVNKDALLAFIIRNVGYTDDLCGRVIRFHCTPD
jgi:hypothetical protein